MPTSTISQLFPAPEQSPGWVSVMNTAAWPWQSIIVRRPQDGGIEVTAEGLRYC